MIYGVQMTSGNLKSPVLHFVDKDEAEKFIEWFDSKMLALKPNKKHTWNVIPIEPITFKKAASGFPDSVFTTLFNQFTNLS